MFLDRSNRRFRKFEKLESRWLLAADSLCEIPAEQPEPSSIEVVAEPLDPADANVEVIADPQNSETESECTESPTSNDGQGSEADTIQANEARSIGGEGESAATESVGSTSVRVATLLGMLEFVTKQGQVNQVRQTEERTSSDSQDIQRRSTNMVQEQALARMSNDSANLLRIEPRRPILAFPSEFTREPRDMPEGSDRQVTAVDANGSATGIGQAASSEADIAVLPSGETFNHSNRDRELSSLQMPFLAERFDLSWLSDKNTGRNTPESVVGSGADEALMAYLRTIQWPLVPLIAGLAYALTRAIDQQAETAEPELVNIRRRQFKRLDDPA